MPDLSACDESLEDPHGKVFFYEPINGKSEMCFACLSGDLLEAGSRTVDIEYSAFIGYDVIYFRIKMINYV